MEMRLYGYASIWNASIWNASIWNATIWNATIWNVTVFGCLRACVSINAGWVLNKKMPT